MRNKTFRSVHINITIKPPSDRALDLNDDHDIAQAMKRLQAEFLALVEDVQYSMFNTVIINNKALSE